MPPVLWQALQRRCVHNAGSIIYFFTSAQLKVYKSLLKEMSEYLFGIILKFFMYSPKHGVCKIPHHELNTQHWFLHFCAVQTLQFLMAAPFFFSLDGMWCISWILSPSCIQSARSVTSGCSYGSCVSTVDVEASYSSTVPSFSPSLCWLCHFLNTISYEVLDGIVLALLILVCSGFFF